MAPTKKQSEETEETSETLHDEIVAEMHRHHHHHCHRHVSWAVILLTAGILFLMYNFGLLSYSLATTMWKLWPLALVLFGIEALLGRSFVGRLVMLIVALAVMLTVVGFAATSAGFLKL